MEAPELSGFLRSSRVNTIRDDEPDLSSLYAYDIASLKPTVFSPIEKRSIPIFCRAPFWVSALFHVTVVIVIALFLRTSQPLIHPHVMRLVAMPMPLMIGTEDASSPAEKQSVKRVASSSISEPSKTVPPEKTVSQQQSVISTSSEMEHSFAVSSSGKAEQSDFSVSSKGSSEGVTNGFGLGMSSGPIHASGMFGTGGVQLDNTSFAPVYNPLPENPMIARQSNIQGWVDVEVTVDELGHVTAFKIIEVSGHPAFGESLSKVISHWRFPPPRIGGKKVSVIYPYRAIFSLN